MKNKAIKLDQPAIIKHALFSRFIVEGIVCVFIILWFYVGITKLIDYRSMILQMEMNPFPIFSNNAKLIGWGVPIVEVLVATILVVPRLRLVGLWSSFVLMVVFTGYVIFLMIKMPTLPCTCGGIISTLTWTQHLVLNIMLVAMAFLAIFVSRRIWKQSRRGNSTS